MLNSIKPELAKRSFRQFCQENEHFAIGVLQQLISTDFCISEPTKANRFSRLAFKFPLNTHEELLECILDCVELLSEAPAELSVLDGDDADGYMLAIKSQRLVGKLVELDAKNPWHLAGILFVQINKNKTTDNSICIINSNLFGKNTFNIVNKFNYLLL
jgi:hypothetical protein